MKKARAQTGGALKGSQRCLGGSFQTHVMKTERHEFVSVLVFFALLSIHESS